MALSLAKKIGILQKIIAFFILFLSAWPMISQATLIVTPTKAVFEDRKHTQEITLIHKGDQEATYRISFQHLRIKQDGSMEEIKEPGPDDRFVDELVRYSPRQVTLKPDEVQTIRLMVRKPKDLPPGEYRSHLLFKEMAPPNMGASIEKGAEEADNSININLIQLFAVTIPVIVRHGNISAKIEIQEAKVISENSPQGGIESKEKISDTRSSSDKEKVPAISSGKLFLKLKRSGNASVTGDITVTFTPADSSKQYEVGRVSGITVYYPNDCRELTIPIKTPEGVFLKNGKLGILFCKPKSEAKSECGTILAGNTLILP